MRDLEVLLELEKKAFTVDRFTPRQYHYLLTRARATTLVLADGATVVGGAVLLWHPNLSFCRLYNIVVDPGRHGEGLGTILLRACEREAEKRRCVRISLEVRTDNAPAIAFYEKHDYTISQSLRDYYPDGADGWRMTKVLRLSRTDRLRLKVPYYAQTLEFTCGSACLMMAFKHFRPSMEFTRQLEITLWREATLVFMTSGIGGIGPFGLALAAQRRGFPTRVVLSREQTPFFSSVRSAEKRKVIRLVHEDLRARALNLGTAVSYRDFAFKEIAAEMYAGSLPIVLISTARLHGDRAPHWVVLTGFDSKYVYFHDSFERFYEDKKHLARNVRIPIAEFNRMRRYGKDLYKSVIFIDTPSIEPMVTIEGEDLP
ncbi:MAG: peptidase C39 family protein [Candidatus Zixiibacteriota bacterium]|nr:MAG: peptidase C39 family protein [candidate division Zixibacteria bacterium]